MAFGSVSLDQAQGCLLAHTLRLPRCLLKKGTRLGALEIAVLREAGMEAVLVARLEEGDVAEDLAARELALALAGPCVRAGDARSGRCNLYAARAGLMLLRPGAVEAINAVHESLTLATLPPFHRVREGELLATVKVIPFSAPRAALEACAKLAREGPLEVAPFQALRAGLVLTRLPGTREESLDRAEEVLAGRLAGLEGALATTRRVLHDGGAVAAALAELLAAHLSPVFLLGASASVDRGDVIPSAIELAGGTVERLGIPVDPGNLLLLAYRGDTPIVGMPGCARSPRASGFDRVLERLAAGLRVDAAALAGLGVGGLMKEILSRPHPREAPEAGRPASPSVSHHVTPGESSAEEPGRGSAEGRPRRRVGAVVLAAGRSSRMGANKLLQPLEGVPLIAWVVDATLAAGLHPVVVVTGHDAPAVEAALADRPVERIRNPRWAEGMSTSLAAGLVALEGEVDGALVCLGDMPRVSSADLLALVAAFDPERGRSVCVPVHAGKRGNPVLWSARCFPAMRELAGDRGARSLLAEHADEVVEVEVGGAGVLLDVDTPEALVRLRDPAVLADGAAEEA